MAADRLSFADFLEKYLQAQVPAITERLNLLIRHSGTCKQVVHNLMAEHRFTSKARIYYATQIAACPCVVDEVIKTINSAAQKFILKGPRVFLPPDAILGRAVTNDEFARTLRDLNYYPDLSTARAALTDLIGRHPSVIWDAWSGWVLGRYVMWSTYDENDPTADPFSSAPPTADLVRGVLGLRPLDKGKPLLLFNYQLDSGAIPRFPTFSDAYAGTPWQVYFRPSIRGARGGQTQPWDEVADNHAGRPEVVHQPIRGNNITAAIRQII